MILLTQVDDRLDRRKAHRSACDRVQRRHHLRAHAQVARVARRTVQCVPATPRRARSLSLGGLGAGGSGLVGPG
jgi:hypothetical protein